MLSRTFNGTVALPTILPCTTAFAASLAEMILTGTISMFRSLKNPFSAATKNGRLLPKGWYPNETLLGCCFVQLRASKSAPTQHTRREKGYIWTSEELIDSGRTLLADFFQCNIGSLFQPRLQCEPRMTTRFLRAIRAKSWARR